MAQFQSSLFNALSGSVGNITMSSFRGKPVVKAKIFQRRKNNSPAASFRRNCFRELSSLSKIYRKVIKRGMPWASWAEARTTFIGVNLKNLPFDQEGEAVIFRPERVFCSKGILIPPLVDIELAADSHAISARWSAQALSPVARDDDEVWLAFVHPVLQQSTCVLLGSRGEPRAIPIELPTVKWYVGELLCYTLAVNPGRKQCSDSLFIGKMSFPG